MRNTNVVPAIGVTIPILNRDWVVRDRDSQKLKAVMEYSKSTDTWTLVDPTKNKGMLVFLNGDLEPGSTHLSIYGVTPTGTACYADPVQI